MEIKRIVLGGLVGVMALSGVAIAGGPQRGPAIGRLIDQLDLTEAQAEHLEEVKAEVHAIQKEARADKRALKVEAMGMLESGQIDEARLHEMIDEAATLAASSAHDGLELMLGFYETLDEDQRAEVSERVAEKRAKAAERRSEAAERFEASDGLDGFDGAGGGL